MSEIWNVDPVLMVGYTANDADYFNHYLTQDKTHCVSLRYKYTVDSIQIEKLIQKIDSPIVVLVQAVSWQDEVITPYMEIMVFYKL